VIPLVTEVPVGTENVRFFWCPDCRELFGVMGTLGRDVASFILDRRGGWRVSEAGRSAADVQSAVEAVATVRPQIEEWNRLNTRPGIELYSRETGVQPDAES
jgi:hypothetical protein